MKHDDLISREDLKKAIESYDKFACLPDGELMPFRELYEPEKDYEPYVHLRDIRNAIDHAPTVSKSNEYMRGYEAAEREYKRPTGEWIDEGQYAEGHSEHAYICKKCGYQIIKNPSMIFETRYCNCCGAKMKGGRK